ncbi:hypothetical protein Sru01_26050 [Sphaerisporangium rufum]|uniref:histidine kinase n=1 Tax=Sphaerisporangium rufum TaxID=1381558 RepID=A0A919V195_9ACTN|nr:hypothetical protein Sru01_26050 [Sphaerisporangium rufum]
MAVLGCLVVLAALLVRRRNQGTAAAREHARRVRDFHRSLLRAEYDYPRPSLADLVQSCRDAGLAVRLHVAGPPRALPDPVDLAGMRILEEALTDVVRHGGQSASVVLCYRPGGITLTVDRPMDGGQPSRRPSDGLATMRRRAGRVGGRLSAGPFEGGWRVRAELPLPG